MAHICFSTDHRLHIGDALDLIGKSRGAGEADRGAPIMEDEDGIFGQLEGIEKGIEIFNVVFEMIRLTGRRRRPTMTDEVGRDDAAQAFDMRDNISPKE